MWSFLLQFYHTFFWEIVVLRCSFLLWFSHTPNIVKSGTILSHSSWRAWKLHRNASCISPMKFWLVFLYGWVMILRRTLRKTLQSVAGVRLWWKYIFDPPRSEDHTASSKTSDCFETSTTSLKYLGYLISCKYQILAFTPQSMMCSHHLLKTRVWPVSLGRYQLVCCYTL